MPWRKTRNPYKVLISEVMLQQTQVSRVLPKYKEFLREFPTCGTLAQVSNKKLLAVWKGLGYWRRALFLKETARQIVRNYKGKFPEDVEALRALPGIGLYTARALACFAFGNREAFLDTNIRRLYLHFFFSNKKSVSDNEILAIAHKAVWKKNPREWHYALFDYGAAVLKDKKINRRSAHYHRQSPFPGSFRFFRTKTVRFLLVQPQNKTPHPILEMFIKNKLTKNPSPRGVSYKERPKDSFTSSQIINSLLKDKLLKKLKRYYSL